MKPLPLNVSVSEDEPATTLAGVMDAMLGVGFGELPEEGGGGVDVPVEELEPPPPQPDRTSKEPRVETTSRQNKRIRSTSPPKRKPVRSGVRGETIRLLPQAVFAFGV
jgi:hypothetical protein